MFYLPELDTFLKIGQGFRGGSDEKLKRMWFGREIVVVGLPLSSLKLVFSPKTIRATKIRFNDRNIKKNMENFYNEWTDLLSCSTLTIGKNMLHNNVKMLCRIQA